MKRLLPQAAQICLATCLTALIYLLQNAEELTSGLNEGSPIARKTADAVRTLGEYTGLARHNSNVTEVIGRWSDLCRGQTVTETSAETVSAEDFPKPQPQIEPEPAPTPTADSSEQPPAPEPQPAGTEDITPTPTPEPETVSPAEPQPEPAPAPEEPAPSEETIPEPPAEEQKESTQEQQPEPTPAPAPETESEPIPNPEVPVPTEPEKPATPRNAPPVRCNIMLLGDSLMEDLGPRLHRNMRTRKGLRFILSAKYSTGLCRPDIFDWPAHMRDVMVQHKPDIVVVFIGANDGQPIRHGNTYTQTGGRKWRNAYHDKMKEIVDIAEAHGARVIWVGLPLMGGKYARLLNETAATQNEAGGMLPVTFVDTRPTLADENGDFQVFRKNDRGKPVRLRRRDLEHLTPEGNRLVIEQLKPVLEQHLVEYAEANPQKLLSEEEVKTARNATMAVTVKYVPSKKASQRR